MTRRRSLGRGLVVLAVAASVLLAGCANIPSSGDVHDGGVITDDSGSLGITFVPSGPRQGAAPSDIVRGFLAAAVSPSDGYAVARQFLASSVRESWNPNAGAVIRSTTATPTCTFADADLPDDATDESCSYAFQSSASVDADGIYTADSTAVTRSLSLVKEDGQWRISALDPGIVLSEGGFEAAFGEYPVYYFDPSFDYLVPDVRWFAQSSVLASRIANALTKEPVDWLRKAVVTQFPSGTKVNGVTINAGTATVDLGDLPSDLTARQKAQIKQQLDASLAGVATVTNVVITSDDAPLAIDESAASTAITPDVGQLPLVLSGKRFGAIAVNGVTSIGGAASRIAEVKPDAITYGIRSGIAAVRYPGGGVHLIGRDGSDRLVDARSGLVEPSLDPGGFAWSAEQRSADSVVATGDDGVQHAVATSFPKGSRLVSLAVSRDGARVLTVLETAGPGGGASTFSLEVHAIIRSDGVPTSLGAAEVLDQLTAVPVDATWVDDTSVAVLAEADGLTTVEQYEIGGPSSALGSAPDGEHIAGGEGGVDGLRILTADGSLLRWRASSWQETGLSADVLATQLPG